MRLSTLVSFVVMVILGFGVYNVANQYDRTEKKLNAVGKKIGGEQEAMRVLQAEWTFLTSPDRLEKISAEYLHLQAVDGRQYVAVASIPMRADMASQEEPEQVASAALVTPAPQLASVTASAKKEPVKQVAAQKPATPSEPEVAAGEVDLEKIIAKELAPVSSNLPPAPKQALPELQAIPVNMTESPE